jgi:sugar (pentulose or hexulose) kinase
MGLGDNQAGTVSVGALAPSDTKVGLSTGAYLDIVFDVQPFDFYHRAAKVFCHPYIDGKWLFEGVVPGSGLAYTWLGENFVPKFNQAASRGDDPYPELEKVASMSPRGSDGLFTMPLFMFKRGMFWGLAYSHNASHLLRSLAESTGYGLRMFFDMAVNLGANPEFLRMDGSGSRSALWKQTMCDVLHRPGSAVKDPEASPILGVAFLLMRSTGAIKDLNEARRSWGKGWNQAPTHHTMRCTNNGWASSLPRLQRPQSSTVPGIQSHTLTGLGQRPEVRKYQAILSSRGPDCY